MQTPHAKAMIPHTCENISLIEGNQIMLSWQAIHNQEEIIRLNEKQWKTLLYHPGLGYVGIEWSHNTLAANAKLPLN